MAWSAARPAPAPENEPGCPPGRGLVADLRSALPAWITARVLVLAALAGSHLLFDVLHLRNSVRLHEGLMAWDGQWYRRIAVHGYEDIARQALRFFPAYPLLARALRPLTAGSIQASLLILSNLPALLFGALLHRLCLREGRDAGLARRAAWLVALAPPAFVMVMAYGEALAGCLGVAMFLALRSRHWWGAVPCGFMAGLLRPAGALLAVPAAVEAVAAGRGPWRQMIGRVAAVVAPLAGVALYLAWVGTRFGDALIPAKVQNQNFLRGGFSDPLRATVGSGIDLLRGHLNPNGHHFPWIVLALVLLVLAFRHWPLSYGAFAAATVVAALSAERLGSFERYAFGAFPLVLAVASITGRPRLWRPVVALSGAAMVILATLAFLNGYVP